MTVTPRPKPKPTQESNLNQGKIPKGLALSRDGVFRTIQGEGPLIGRNTTFLRLAGCNLACSWCDTAYTWDWKNYSPKTEVDVLLPESVLGWIESLGSPNLTVTGGEPLLQWTRLDEMFTLAYLKYGLTAPFFQSIQFETNGTIFPEFTKEAIWACKTTFMYVISPKLRNSGKVSNRKHLSKFLARGSSWFKFVCETPEDLEEVADIQKEVGIPNAKIFIMPQGVDAGVLRDRALLLVEEVLVRGWNLSPRLHVQLWENARGR